MDESAEWDILVMDVHTEAKFGIHGLLQMTTVAQGRELKTFVTSCICHELEWY